jgi:histidyl-tRNA synthetase
LSEQPNIPKVSAGPKFRAVRGVRDILPPETALWNRVEQTAREVFRAYGFGEIRLAIFEQTELFARSIGGETDVVSKEMYSFEDRGSGGLAGVRDFMLVASVDQRDPRTFATFTGLAQQFASLLDQGVASGEIPATLENDRRIQMFRERLRHLAEIEGRDSTAQNQVDSVRFWAFMIQVAPLITLRPEATASVVRAYIEHGMHTLPGSVKLYYMGPMFRRERPQKGRYRQFYQIGAEVLGPSDAPSVDAEVIEMLMDYFGRLQLAGTTLYVNSIGCKDCRPVYVQELREALLKVKEHLGADSQRRIETNPLRVLDSKIPTEQPIIETLPRIADHLCEACTVHFAALQEELKLRQIFYEVNWRLVRGLDYYTRTTFEIIAPGLGSQNALCGGGRYDGLVELLGGPPTKGIGFAIGLDRLILSLQELGKDKVPRGPDVFVAWMGQASWPLAVRVARQLRDAGISVEVPAEEMKFRKALGLADKLGARYALILGEDEVASGQLTLKRLADGEQRKVSAEQLPEYLSTELQFGMKSGTS